MIALFVISAFFVLYTYLGYPVVLAALVWFKNRCQGVRVSGCQSKPEAQPSVSMVVAAHNEEGCIKAKIENFLALEYPHGRIELLIGSDGSTDKTVSLVRPFLSGRVRLSEFDRRRGKAAVLNDIADEARGEVLLFSDADTLYDRDAVKKIVRHFSDNRVGGVCGNLRLVEGAGSARGEGLYWKYENFLKERESRIKTIVSINGQIFAVRKELFAPLPANTITEDQALGMKIISRGYDILFDADAGAEEKIGSLKDEFERRARISAGNFQSIRHSLSVLDPRAGFASFALWSHKMLRWLAPFFLILIFVINIFLLQTRFFKFLFLAQTLFYSISACSPLLRKAGSDIRALEAMRYLTIMNLAILIGFARFLANSQKTTWRKAA